MVEQKKLSDLAAQRLCPDNVEEGLRQIEAVAKRLLIQIYAFEAICVAALAFGTIILMAVLAVAVRGFHPLFSISSFKFFGLTAFGAVLLFGGMNGRRIFQTRKRLLTRGLRYDAALPDKLEVVLDDIISNKLDAYEHAPYGPTTPSALRTSDGWLDPMLPETVFTNRYAPLLLSQNAKLYQHVWMPRGKTICHPIYVVPHQCADVKREEEAAPIETVGTTANDENPVDEKFSWLLLGTDKAFEKGIEAFIKARNIQPPQDKRFRTILLTARRYVRTWGVQVSQKQLVAAIQDELKVKYGVKVEPHPLKEIHKPRVSDSTIISLINGEHVSHDIKIYFPGNSQTISTPSSIK